MKKRLFEIVTLQDQIFPSYRNTYKKLSDPLTILTGGVAVLSQIFPNIFGGNRRLLTESDWIQLIPGAGFWSTKLRNYLKIRIRYDVDFVNNVQPLTINFVADNNATICPKTYTFQNPPGTNPGGSGGGTGWEPCYARLIQILKEEQQSGGTSPVGNTPGGYGQTINWNSILPIALVGIVLVAFMKNKKK